MPDKSNFSALLRWWRNHRGLSQLALAGHAGVSQRHLSFLELGRAFPSREMVCRLGDALDVPFRQQNAMLAAAGFAPLWRETDLTAPDLSQVSSALDFMLAQQEPYPAVVVDRHWSLLKANSGAVRLVEFLVGPLAPDAEINLADALVAPDVLRPHLENWPEIANYFIRSVEADAQADGTTESAALLERLRAYDGVGQMIRSHPAASYDGPILPMRFRKDGVRLALFTTIATLGTPQDITLQELRIENFFPLDDATRDQFRDWA